MTELTPRWAGIVATLSAIADAGRAVQQGIGAVGGAVTPEPPTIRIVDGRRMQCKDISDELFLAAVRRAPGTSACNWRMRWDVRAELEAALGPIPENLFLAKARKLCAAGKLGGCPCGCRGDYHLLAECDGGETCCPTQTTETP